MFVKNASLAERYAPVQEAQDKPKPDYKTVGYLAVATLVSVAVAAFFLHEDNPPAGIVFMIAGIGFLSCCVEASRRNACRALNSIV